MQLKEYTSFMCRSVSTEGWSERQPSSISPSTNPGIGERVFVQSVSREVTANGHSEITPTIWPAGKDLVPEQADEGKTAEKHDFGN